MYDMLGQNGYDMGLRIVLQCPLASPSPEVRCPIRCSFADPAVIPRTDQAPTELPMGVALEKIHPFAQNCSAGGIQDFLHEERHFM